jgi:sulfatase modifying factor 1
MAHDVFISYSSKNKPVADAVCAGLEGRGIRCWIAPRDILAGETWAAAIIAAIENCQVFVLVASRESFRSGDVLREVQNAANMVPIIPFRIEEADLPPEMRYYLSVPHWLDALTPPLEGHIERLAVTVNLLLERAGALLQSPGSRLVEEIVGPDGGAMVWVPAGEFMMGSNDDDDDDDGKPAHKVRITRGFWLGKHEVTNAQYRAYCKATQQSFPSGSNLGDDHPVVDVLWDDVVAYCTHYGLRLPTEAEWEYAARGPEGRTYPWGDEWDAKRCCNMENRGPGARTYPVGSFPAGASWCGALDLAGNVWDWCADWYDAEYYGKSPAQDPPGPVSGQARLLRGGSWGRFPNGCRSAFRFGEDPTGRGSDRGFRVARTP